MIVLRRIATDLREIRWGHVLVELVLVIAGILIALAVNDWMEARKDARAERQYLELLARDLDHDTAVLTEVRQFQEAWAAEAAAAYVALAAPVAPADREALATLLVHLTMRRTLRYNPATYADLTSTGTIRLIRNRDLRERLAKYYANTERAAAILERNNQFFVDENYVQYLSDHGLIAQRASSNTPAHEKPIKEFQARTGMNVTTASDRLWTLPADAPERTILHNKVWLRGQVAQQASSQLANVLDELGQVRQAVGDELAARQWPGD